MKTYVTLTAPLLLALIAACGDPGKPAYVDPEAGTDSAVGSDGNRGAVWITEVMWAGSYQTLADGSVVHHVDDYFLELFNDDYVPLNLTGWHLIFQEGLEKTFRIPSNPSNPPIIQPGSYLVVARTRDLAFIDAQVVIPDLEIPRLDLKITLKDADMRLIEGVGTGRGPNLAGADDLRSARSMERTSDSFNNDGNKDSSWHTYNRWITGNATDLPSVIGIASGFRERTFASPGLANMSDYGTIPDVSNPDDTRG